MTEIAICMLGLQEQSRQLQICGAPVFFNDTDPDAAVEIRLGKCSSREAWESTTVRDIDLPPKPPFQHNFWLDVACARPAHCQGALDGLLSDFEGILCRLLSDFRGTVLFKGPAFLSDCHWPFSGSVFAWWSLTARVSMNSCQPWSEFLQWTRD